MKLPDNEIRDITKLLEEGTWTYWDKDGNLTKAPTVYYKNSSLHED